MGKDGKITYYIPADTKLTGMVDSIKKIDPTKKEAPALGKGVSLDTLKKGIAALDKNDNKTLSRDEMGAEMAKIYDDLLAQDAKKYKDGITVTEMQQRLTNDFKERDLDRNGKATNTEVGAAIPFYDEILKSTPAVEAGGSPASLPFGAPENKKGTGRTGDH